MAKAGLKTGQVCFVRPNRTKDRVYTANDVARLFCSGVQQGHFTVQEFEDARGRRCPGLQSDCAELRNYIQSILEALAAILLLLGLPQTIGARAILLLGRLLPRALLERLGIYGFLTQFPAAAAELEKILINLKQLTR